MGSFFYALLPTIYAKSFFIAETYSWGDLPTTSLKQLKKWCLK